MMKVSVITLHSVCNYGTQLQAFATQEKLKEYFENVEFVDYRRKDTYGIGLVKTFSKGNIFRAISILPTILYWRKIFLGFQKRYLNIAKPRHLTDTSINSIQTDSDAYIVGSDQVWNTGWNKGIIPTMYLEFVSDEIPKYSYSSSFGKQQLSEEEIIEVKKYIERFKYISVRENSGVSIIRDQLKFEKVCKIIDPTLVMTPDFWRKYSGKRKIKEKYILIYNLNRSKEFDKYAEKISKKTGYKLYRFCTRFDQILRNGKSLIIPEIFDFINYVDNAEYVLTDSFHATAFSINMNTEPICVYPNNYSNRISEFLELVHAEDRHAINYDDFNVLEKKTDFNKTDEILNKERNKANAYLDSIKKDLESMYER